MSAAPGYFGKLPGAGDFVQRRLPPEFLDPWDRAFSQAVASARDRLGPRWSEAYRGAPAWRFLLSPGIAGRQAWCGVLLPGIDRVPDHRERRGRNARVPHHPLRHPLVEGEGENEGGGQHEDCAGLRGRRIRVTIDPRQRSTVVGETNTEGIT